MNIHDKVASRLLAVKAQAEQERAIRLQGKLMREAVAKMIGPDRSVITLEPSYPMDMGIIGVSQVGPKLRFVYELPATIELMANHIGCSDVDAMHAIMEGMKKLHEQDPDGALPIMVTSIGDVVDAYVAQQREQHGQQR